MGKYKGACSVGVFAVLGSLHQTECDFADDKTLHVFINKCALSLAGSALARTDLLPFARCTLGLNHHSPAIFI